MPERMSEDDIPGLEVDYEDAGLIRWPADR